MEKDFEKAVKKMEKRMSERVPGLKLITSGLSIRVDGMKGPMHACNKQSKNQLNACRVNSLTANPLSVQC